MKFSAQRFAVSTWIGGTLTLMPWAEPAGAGATLWAGAAHVGFGGVLLMAGASALLWRWQRRHDALAHLRRRLAQESALRASADKALLETHAKLCKLVALQESIREDERRRIGHDIHDDLGQNLLALKIDISLLHVGSAGLHPQLHQKLGALAATIDLTIRSLRGIINDLRPTALEAGLKAAVERQFDEFSRISGIACALDADADAFDCASKAALDTMLLRVLQESLSNIARHARASTVKVALRRDGAGLTMTVRDDGIGMPQQRLPRGCGLLGMQDRVAAAGGRFAIDSLPGQGTLLSLSIPLAESLPAR